MENGIICTKRDEREKGRIGAGEVFGHMPHVTKALAINHVMSTVSRGAAPPWLSPYEILCSRQ